jgi:uncharacterized membrane protein
MPDFAPLLAAPWPVIVHFFTVVPAFFLGAWLLAVSRKGAPAHRALGKVYLTLMAATAFTAIFIDAFSSLSVQVGPLRIGLIHLFIPLTFWSVWRTRRALREGNIEAHRASMRGLYLGGLIIAGLLTFAPGRIMYRMFFG